MPCASAAPTLEAVDVAFTSRPASDFFRDRGTGFTSRLDLEVILEETLVGIIYKYIESQECTRVSILQRLERFTS